MRFITLSRERDGRPLYVALDHMAAVYSFEWFDGEQDRTGSVVEVGSEFHRVRESPDELFSTLARILDGA